MPKKNLAHVFLLIFFLGILAYANILDSPFQFDDRELLLGNPYLKSIPSLIRYYRNEAPQKFLTILTFSINYYLGKEDTLGYHLVNVTLHILTAFILYRCIALLFDAPALCHSRFFSHKNYFSLFVSLIFLLHPLQTESVTQIWQRSEVLGGFFYLSAYFFYLFGRFQKKIKYFVLSMTIFYIGFFTKGTIVTLPILILVTELIFFKVKKETKIRIAVYSALLITTILVLWDCLYFFNILEKIHLSFLAGTIYPSWSKQYFFTEFKVLLLYIKLSFFPVDQSLGYCIPYAKSLFEPVVLLPLLTLLSIFGTALLLARKQPLMSFGIFWFFIYLIPTSAGLTIKPDPMWEHRVYLSMAGFAIFLMSLLLTVIKNNRIRTLIAVGLVGVFMLLTIFRNILWRSPILLMEDAARKSPHCLRPQFTLAALYQKEGRIEAALRLYEKIISKNPQYALPYNNLGLLYMQSGDTNYAEKLFKKAIELQTDFITPYFNLAYIAIGKNDYLTAEELLKAALAIKPTDKAYLGLGKIQRALGRYKESQENFQKALELNPDNKRIIFNPNVNNF